MSECDVPVCPGPDGDLCPLGYGATCLGFTIPGQMTVEEAIADAALPAQDGRCRVEQRETQT